MIPIPTGVRVWLATGYTDMRKGFPGLSLQVQEVLRRDPLGGHLFCFRGRRSDLLKVIWHDGQGACLFTKPHETALREIRFDLGALDRATAQPIGLFVPASISLRISSASSTAAGVICSAISMPMASSIGGPAIDWQFGSPR